jgi:hypothetical protein
MPRRSPDQPFDLKTSTRRGTLSVVMWVFGLSTTLLLVAMWGRAVTVDQATVAESAAVMVDADIAQNRVVDWIEDAMVQTQSIGPGDAQTVIENVRATPQMDAAIQNLTAAFVAALFAPEGTDPIVDVREAMAPAIPVIAQELAQRDVPISESSIVAVLDANDLDLSQDDTSGVVAVVREARTIVSTAVVVALAVMMLAGATAVSLSDEKFAMVRTLGIRVLLSALSFAVFFRLGGWALDPQRGRSPLVGGTGLLLGSNGHVFVITAVIAAAVAGIGAWAARNIRKQRAAPSRQPFPTEDDTRELVSA